jgi:hypothetical protein
MENLAYQNKNAAFDQIMMFTAFGLFVRTLAE